MDYVLIFFGIILMITGILGCVLPLLPGPPLNFIGLLLLHFITGTILKLIASGIMTWYFGKELITG